MQRHKAKKIARANLKAHRAAQIEFTMKVWAVMTDIEARERAQQELDAKYGCQHGWYSVGGHSFNREMLTGEKYDVTQGGWAFL